MRGKKVKTASVATVLATLLLSLPACQKSANVDSPEGVLKAYIEKSFNIRSVEDRKELEVFLAGNAKQRLAAWSDDQFRQAFIDSQRKFRKLVFHDTKTIGNSQVSITYEVAFQDLSQKKEVLITSLKVATFEKVSGSWRIQDVKNIKETLEYANEMSLP